MRTATKSNVMTEIAAEFGAITLLYVGAAITLMDVVAKAGFALF